MMDNLYRINYHQFEFFPLKYTISKNKNKENSKLQNIFINNL